MGAGTLEKGDTRAEIDDAHAAQGTEPGTVPGVGDQPAAEGANGQFELLIGGKAPTTKAVRLYGGAIKVEPPEGGFKKGARYVLEIETVCHKASFTDERDDKTNEVVGSKDERGLKITGVRYVEQL